MPCSSSACVPQCAREPMPEAAGALALRDVQAAQKSLDSVVSADTWAPGALDPLAPNLAVPQYRRTFVQGCACSTGFAGGGCCPSGAAGMALQTGCRAHHTLGFVTGAAGALGLYGGARVVANSLDALRQIRRVEQSLMPKLDSLALLQSQAASAELPCARVGQQVHALQQWAQSLKVSAAEQTYNFWVPGVLQILAASSAIYTAMQHTGLLLLGPLVGAYAVIAAPALFATYSVLLACKSIDELRRVPPHLSEPSATAPIEIPSANSTFAAKHACHMQARRTTLKRTALGWGLVGASGVGTTLAAAGIWATAVGSGVFFGLSLSAAAFAMWQNSQTRYVPHLPISPHVDPQAVGEAAQRQASVQFLGAQDEAVKQAVAQLHGDLCWTKKSAHRLERMFRPQCGPSANRVLANFVQTVARSPDKARAARHTRILLQAATAWCTAEIALVHGRLKDAEKSLAADVGAMHALLAPSCKHKAARMQKILLSQGPLVQTYNQAGQYLRDDAQKLETAKLRLRTLEHCLQQLHALHQEDMQDLLTASEAKAWSPAQRWLSVRLNLLLISGTLGDALDAELIIAHKHLFSQLTHTEALPLANVYVLPAQLAALEPIIAPRLDAGFVHAFFNPRRIEAEIDYLLELEATEQKRPESVAKAPLCTAKSCCN